MDYSSFFLVLLSAALGDFNESRGLLRWQFPGDQRFLLGNAGDCRSLTGNRQFALRQRESHLKFGQKGAGEGGMAGAGRWIDGGPVQKKGTVADQLETALFLWNQGERGPQTDEELDLIAKFSGDPVSFDDLLEYAREIQLNAKSDRARKALDRYITTLKAMADKKTAVEKEKDKVKKLLNSLRDQRDFGWFIAHDPASPAAKLISLGKDAIPHLIDTLENDDFTRSVYCPVHTSREIPEHRVMRIGDCACGILSILTGKNFGDKWCIHDPGAQVPPKDVKRLYKEWWDKQAPEPDGRK